MKRLQALTLMAGLAALGLGAVDAQAQYVTYYQPPVYQPTVSYYAPAPVVAPAAYTAPVYTVARPLTYTVASPVVAPAPVVVPAPVPVVTYYRAPAVSYVATPQVVTRYRPFLGGTVSRVRYGYAPVVY
jgi:hypothetical protein